MLLYFTESRSNRPVAINPEHVVMVLTLTEGEFANKTFIIYSGGNIAVEENELDVVGRINAELKGE